MYSDLTLKQKFSVLLILIIALALWAFDAIDDLSHGSNLAHILLEAVVLCLLAFWAANLAIRYYVSKRENIQIKGDLIAVRRDLDDYRKETAHLAKGLSLKIDQQLEKWEMTKAEKEIAFLLLKGFSNKEIADIRGTSEKTVIQQVSAVYEKSRLHNRAEFSAFFLEDLLLPLE